METMRRVVAIVAMGMVGLASAASAQTAGVAGGADRGYIEAGIQSAFGNVTTQAFSGELGITVHSGLQVFVEGGAIRDVATPETGVAAQSIAGALSQTQANVTYTVRQPVTFGVAGLKILVPTGGMVHPYALAGAGIANVRQDVSFAVGGTDVTSSLPTQFGVTLGTDLSGSFTKPMFVAGGGAMLSPSARLVLDLQFRYGRIMADDGGINVSRVGIGVGLRF
jgi:opacity protein-like surface antigen